MARIAVLNEALVNKIAAGEVVERPASVVKELCENALDAGARTIRVSVREGGLDRIEVSDDGRGMSREDAVLSLTRHATSKLKDLEGLFSIATMGFRGEALPAIAAVSRFTMSTAEPGSPVGTRIHVEAHAPEVSDAAPVPGTQVVVEDLFFNTPARRKFMRREPTEKRHCEEAVVRLALAHPEVAFHFEADGVRGLVLPAGPDGVERIAAALGGELAKAMLPVEERRLGLTVRGFAGAPEVSFPNARGVYTFVNRRYIRDRALNAAISRAYQDRLPHGRQPVVVLQLELDPRDVDVNVHPQKLEVRFQDASGVAEAVSTGLRRALESRSQASTGTLDFAGEQSYASAVQRFLSQARASEGPLPVAMDAPAELRPAFGTARPDLNHAPPPGYFAALTFLGMLGRRFWICEGRGATLVAIDPHAARERAIASELRRAGSVERSLFGAAIDLPAAEAAALLGALPALASLGFEVEPFGGRSLAVKSIPAGLETSDVSAVLAELAAVLPDEAAARRVLACCAAGRQEREPSREEAAALFRRLDGADFALVTRHATVVVAELPFLELERKAR